MRRSRQPSPNARSAASAPPSTRALAAGNVHGIAPVLADNAQLVTGADSMIVSGKAAQLALWTEDLSGPKRRS